MKRLKNGKRKTRSGMSENIHTNILIQFSIQFLFIFCSIFTYVKMNTTLTGAEKSFEKMLSNAENIQNETVKNETISTIKPEEVKDNNLTIIPPNAILNQLDTLDNISVISDENASMSEGNSILRFKPMKFLYKVCNDSALEEKICEKKVGNPYKIKFLHDFMVYLLLLRSEAMLLSCSGEANDWTPAQMKEYHKLRELICTVHKKLRENVWKGFRLSIFQDFRGYNYISKELYEKLMLIFAKL